MFCKNCSKELLNGETFCSQCGAPAGEGINYCSNCGTYTPQSSYFCPRCGDPVNGEKTTDVQSTYIPPAPPKPIAQEPKSRLAVGIVALILGSLGIHNFYLGYKGRGYAQFFMTLFSYVVMTFTNVSSAVITAVIATIWALVEAIRILSGSVNTDAYGIEFKA